jgi:hypothetical protein
LGTAHARAESLVRHFSWVSVVNHLGTWAECSRPSQESSKLLKRMVGASGFEPPASWSRTSTAQILSALSGVAYGRRTLISPFLVVPNLYPAIGCINELSGAPGEIRTPDPLLRSRLCTFIKTCRSERKAEKSQQVVTSSDKPLAPSSSHLRTLFAAICHDLYYVFMTAKPREQQLWR